MAGTFDAGRGFGLAAFGAALFFRAGVFFAAADFRAEVFAIGRGRWRAVVFRFGVFRLAGIGGSLTGDADD